LANPLEILEGRSQRFLIAAPLAIVVVLGLGDYLTGYELSFSTFYLVAVALATWYVGKPFGALVSILSVVVGLVTDVAAGAHYSYLLIPVWNATLTLASYLIVVWLLGSLRSLHKELEERVCQRTAALTTEVAERRRLEREIMEMSERERCAIGRDLHDSLGQHLTATALAGQVLEEKLAARSLAEAADARRVVDLIEGGVELTRSLARGLSPLAISADGFLTSLRELAAIVGDRFNVDCQCECEQPALMGDGAMATHLYRIAQEAVTNAVKHGHPQHIRIRLSRCGTGSHLTVTDDGDGLPEPLPKTDGMGLRIMAHRASILGGTLAVSPGARGGTVVTCTVP
jgi:signal transduction histidine kinase